MADTTNNPKITKFQEVRDTPAMQRIESNVQQHYKDATKSVKLLRTDLLTAHSLLAEASCAGQFSAWLKLMGIPRATAYYILGKKDAKGRFSKEGTGKWGIGPKRPLTKKQRQARARDAKKNFKKRIVEYLKSLDSSGKARNFLASLFGEAYKDAAPLTTQNLKTFDLAEQQKKEKAFLNTPAGKFVSKLDGMSHEQQKDMLKFMDTAIGQLDGKKKPAASVRKESNVQPAATA